MSEYRAGYDVTEVAFIVEGTYGTKPTSGAWKPFGVVTKFDPHASPTIKEKVGLGRQTLSAQQIVKKAFECDIEWEVQAESTNPAFCWAERLRYILNQAAYGASLSLDKRINSQSIGAKLDLATDEFFLLTGCKCDKFEIGSEGGHSIIKVSEHLMAQNMLVNTTDYVSGTATRNAALADSLAFIRHADCDIQINTGGGYTNLYDRVNSWKLRLTRDLSRRGSSLTDKTLYQAIIEGKMEIALDLNLDFNSLTEYTQFLADTGFDIKVSIPTGTGGKALTLSTGKWNSVGSPLNEMDTVDVSVSSKFASIAVATL